MAVKPIPDGYSSVTPYLVVDGAAKLIDFLKQAFGAEARGGVMSSPDGTVGHAEMHIGDSLVMLADATAQSPAVKAMLHLYVEDCDATYQRAVDAGATSVRELKDEFYGDRAGSVRDPFGNQWYVATHKEDVSEEEMGRRMRELAASG
ncbi:MAG: VOC family protein [Candidatus Dormibacteria bacterium]